jgi:hypothetical protein
MATKKYTAAQRRALAKKKKALPASKSGSAGGFPIETPADLKRAKQAIGRAKNPAAARAHVNRRAKALGKPAIGKKKR